MFNLLYKSSNMPEKIVEDYNKIISKIPKNPEEFSFIFQKMTCFEQYSIFLDLISDFSSFRLDFPSKKLWEHLPSEIIAYFSKFSLQKKNMAKKIDPQTFFFINFEENQLFSPFLFNSNDFKFLGSLKQLNKLAKKQLLSEESHYLNYSFFLENIVKRMTSFIQSINLLKSEFLLRKKEKIALKIKENLNFYYKAIFKHVFIKFMFHLNDLNKNYEDLKENFWFSLVKIMIFFESFNLFHCNLFLFNMIEKHLSLKPNIFSEVFKNMAKFTQLFEKDRDNFSFIYFSSKNIKALKANKIPIKIQVL